MKIEVVLDAAVTDVLLVLLIDAFLDYKIRLQQNNKLYTVHILYSAKQWQGKLEFGKMNIICHSVKL